MWFPCLFNELFILDRKGLCHTLSRRLKSSKKQCDGTDPSRSNARLMKRTKLNKNNDPPRLSDYDVGNSNMRNDQADELQDAGLATAEPDVALPFKVYPPMVDKTRNRSLELVSDST